MQSDNAKMPKDFVSEMRSVVNYPNFEKSVHVIQHDLQGFIVKNMDGESTEANDIFCRSWPVA